jgi:peptidoglycan/xylan/chitin deacetylase (PgdA/CDA1 family)
VTLGIARRLRWAAGRLRHGSGPWGVILLYHRVGDGGPDPWGLNVTTASFAEQMQVLRREAQPVSLGRLLEALGHPRPLRPLVAVTFDDGYAETLRAARVVLERHDIPATAFLTSGYIGGDREYWWDALERAVLEPRRLPERLVLRSGAARREWRLAGGERGRRRLLASLHGWLRPLPDRDRRALMDELCGWAGVSTRPRSSRRPLSEEEVHRLASGGPIEVGAHTETHPTLAWFSALDQRAEIEGGKKRLEEIVDRPVTQFAYPHGGPSDYTRVSQMLVREAGFAVACAAFAGGIWPGGDLFALPRVETGNWDGEAMTRLLRQLA